MPPSSQPRPANGASWQAVRQGHGYDRGEKAMRVHERVDWTCGCRLVAGRGRSRAGVDALVSPVCLRGRSAQTVHDGRRSFADLGLVRCVQLGARPGLSEPRVGEPRSPTAVRHQRQPAREEKHRRV